MNILFISRQPLRVEGLSAILKQECKDWSTEVNQQLPGLTKELSAAAVNADLMVVDDSAVPETDGETLSEIARTFVNVRKVRYATPLNSAGVYGLLSAGYAGYITKDTSAEAIVAALKLIMNGGVYIPPGVYEQPAAAKPLSIAEPALAPLRGERNIALTNRQKDVLHCIARGMSNREIAGKLGLSEGTVKIHVYNIFKTLNVRNRVSALVTAKKLGYRFSDKDE